MKQFAQAVSAILLAMLSLLLLLSPFVLFGEDSLDGLQVLGFMGVMGLITFLLPGAILWAIVYQLIYSWQISEFKKQVISVYASSIMCTSVFGYFMFANPWGDTVVQLLMIFILVLLIASISLAFFLFIYRRNKVSS
jgi:hypothetical protein